MTRAVLDANVFALLVSPPILGEVDRVLAYPKIARRHGWSKKEILAFVSYR